GAIEWRDTTAPTLAFLQPAANAWVRQTVTVQAQATDSGSGVATLTLIAGASTLSTSLSPPPPAASVTGTAAWATTTFPDGATTLTAQATDRAGTAPAPVTRVVLIDNTAPDTQITAGPVGTIADPTVTFIFTGTDNLTPVGNLVFAWRLDGGAWSAFSGTTSATLTNVAVGAHTFDVKARDLAGNEDATPATRSFTVSFIPAITGLTPASGRIGTPVTITGFAFGFTPIAVAFNGTPAVIQSRTATAITTTAPPGMTSGLVSVTTPYGTATSPSPFTLVTEDFSLAIAPAATQVLQGSTTSFTVTPTGTANLTSAVALTVGGLPSGVTGTFAPPTVAPGQAAALVLTTTSSAALGTATFTVTATTTTDGSVVTHTATGSLTVVAAGQTALVGRVLDTNGVPLQNVAIRIGSTFVSTDAGGNFLFLNPPTGSQVVLIDGDPASPSADQHYPTIPVTVTIVANQTNPLPFVPYLHVQQNYNFTRIDPGTDTVATDPALPGVQLTIDATNSIMGWDGQAATKVSIRTVPINRLPITPLPPTLRVKTVYMFYFGKIGGGVPAHPVPFQAPNDLGLAPGAKAQLWYYDESPIPGQAPNDWRMAGTATVSADGATIATDPGAGIPKFCCGATALAEARQGSSSTPPSAGATAVDPVDLLTGQFIVRKTDLAFAGRLPMAIQRYYASGGNQAGITGLDTTFERYNDFLRLETDTSVTLIVRGNAVVKFLPQPDGAWVNATIPYYRGARITTTAQGYALRFKDGLTHTFSPLGYQNGITDRNGNTITLTRTGFGGNIASVREPSGRGFTFSGYINDVYDPLAKVTWITDPLGRTVEYRYDAASRLIGVVDANGGLTRYDYDGQNRITAITDPRGITYLRNVYDVNGRVCLQEQADGGVWQLHYITTDIRDAMTPTVPPGFYPPWRVGNGPPPYVLSVVPPSLPLPSGQGSLVNAGVTTVTFPGGPAPVTFTVPVPDPIVLAFPGLPCGTPVTTGPVVSTIVVDPRNNRTAYTFNGDGFLTSITRPDGGALVATRDATNLITAVTDPLGRVQSATYDAVGNVRQYFDPGNTTNPWIYAYDPVYNQLTSVTDPLNHTTAGTPDGHGNLLTVTDPRLGPPWTLTYDSSGQLKTVTIPGGTLPTSLSYDANGNLTTITDPLNNTMTRAYDVASRLVQSVDPLGNVARLDYDALDNLTAVADALGGTTRFSYDANGNRRTVTDARGGTTTYTYDVMDRVQTRTDPVNASEHFTYDPLGNLTLRVDRKNQTNRFDYDAMNRPSMATWADGTVTAYSWDPVDRLTSVVETRPGPVVTSVVNDFDVLDRLVTQITALGSVSSTYDLTSRRLTMNATTYDWDEASNLKHITRPIPGGSLVASFTYDPAGRRSTRTVTAPTPSQGVSTTYNYDPASQLIGLTHSRNGAAYGDLTYTYDAAGNPIAVGGSLARTLLPDSVSGAVYNAANRQTQFGASTMTFDANGNLQTLPDNQGTTLFWDAQDRLMSLTRGDGLTASFGYDGLGRRVSKTVNGVTTAYAYDGRDILSTLTANGLTDYLMGPPLDEPLAQNGGTQFYLADALGSVITLADTTGAGDTTYTYAPFGTAMSVGAATTNHFGFTGREADETGLYYYRARYYSPVLQRFVSEDPIACLTQDSNPYPYVGNAPTRWVDPLGLQIAVPMPHPVPFPPPIFWPGTPQNKEGSSGFGVGSSGCSPEIPGPKGPRLLLSSSGPLLAVWPPRLPEGADKA
ncbi:MAG: hypothetical protein HY294_07535, partial [Candidatus Rokubacteria bacterium]|nr:hypothetical protein [Candidatus Rokubacteria bacterium]